MNKVFSILVLAALAASTFAQGSQPAKKPKSAQPKKPLGTAVKKSATAAVKKPKPAPAPTPTGPEAENKSFDEAVAAPTMSKKARMLRAFIDRFPDSEMRADAYTYLITARAAAGDEMIRAGDVAGGVASLKLAVEEAPLPVPERLFNDVILKIPVNLFYGGQRPAAMELAQAIEKKVAASPKQLLSVAAFYMSIENGAEAKRVAEAAIAVDPASPAGYMALGLAHRLNFDLEESAKAYAKAVEVDPSSVPAKRSLAEMNRALGKPEASVAAYREILAANENDAVARQGLILSLFDSGQQKEAESELARVLQAESRNFSLLTSVAYWYAANEQGEKAVEYAQKAVDIEPRYIWGHIALARGLMKQNRPVDAERALLRARQYGNFPTLDYELASAKFQAGLYREAAEELQKNFSIKDGLVGTRLGGRIYKQEKSFQDLISYERKASLLQPLPADRAETAEKLKILLELIRKLEQPADDAELSALTDEFVSGTDKMKLHRQLYAANLLLSKNIALPKVAELVKASVGNLDAGLDVSAPGAAVMASELYESRSIAFSRNEVIVIPEVPRQTLSAILRGRIEELAGWTLYQQKNYPEAAVRLRRSVSVLPDKSAWWRSSMWRLGAALEADGKDKEALDSYIKSYITDRPNAWKYGTIEALYRKVNGNTDGLEDKIGANPLAASSGTMPVERLAVEAAKTDPEANTGSSSVPPPSLTTATERFPRHVPVDTNAGRPPKQEHAVAEKAEINIEKTSATPAPESVKVDETKNTDTKSDTTAVQISPNENKAAENASIVTEPVPPKVESKTAETKTEPTVQQTLPPAEIKENPVVQKETPSEPAKTVSAEPEAVKTDGPPASPTKDLELKNDTETPGVKQIDSKAQPVENNPVPQQVSVKEQAVVPKPEENAPAKETVSEPKSTDAKPDALKTEPEPVKEPSSSKAEPPKDEKIPNTESVNASTAKTEVPAESRPPEPEIKTDVPAKTDAEKTEPVNLLRDPFAKTQSEPAKSERPVIIVNDPFKPGEKPAKPKSLFEPVIINIPENTQAGKQKETPASGDKRIDESAVSSGTSRRRVIEGKEIVSDQQCSIDVSQESIMLLSGGGSLGLRVSITGEGDIKDITASSGSPRDVEVRAEPAIDGAVAQRRFYVIKSISDRVGLFQVNFESPCGKREIAVHVR